MNTQQRFSQQVYKNTVALQRRATSAGGTNILQKQELLLKPRYPDYGATHLSLPICNQKPVASISNVLICSRIQSGLHTCTTYTRGRWSPHATDYVRRCSAARAGNPAAPDS